jgi:succinate dehydrogenase/fumarate reductase iron-sulfur protein
VKVLVKVLRGEGNRRGEWQAYSVEVSTSATVLEVLSAIRREQDGTLAFREGCGAELCGSCGMLVNQRPALACATSIGALQGQEVRLEPLPGFEVVRDLVVDFRPMHAAAERMKPYLLRRTAPPAEEVVQSAEDWTRLSEAARCITCGVCLAACPLWRLNQGFMGAAAAVKGYRFLADSRDEGTGERLAGAGDEQSGVWRCHSVLECTRTCPAEIDAGRMMARWRAAILQFGLRGQAEERGLRRNGSE